MFQDRLILLSQVAYFCHSLAKNTTEKKKDKKDMNTNTESTANSKRVTFPFGHFPKVPNEG